MVELLRMTSQKTHVLIITENTIPLLKINIILVSHIYRQIGDW